METKTRIRYSAVCALALVMAAGCGGGGGAGGGSSTQTVASLVSQGTAQLNSALSSQTVQPGQLNAAFATFSQAYKMNPNDPDAAMGYALTQCVQAVENSAGVFATSLFPSASATADRLLLLSSKPAYVPAVNSVADPLPLGWHMPQSSSVNPNYTLNLLPTTIQAILVALEPSLQNVVTALSNANLTALEAKPMVVEMYVNGTLTSVNIGKAEGLVLRGAAEGVLGLVNLATAYNLDAGSFNWESTVINKNSKFPLTLTTANFLPGSPFATLTTTGKASMKAFGTQSVAGMTDEIAAIDWQKSRSTSKTWLLGVSASASDLATDRSNAVEYLDLLTLERSITFLPYGSTKAVTTHIDLPAWFSNPPATLDSVFGTLTATQATNGAITVAVKSGSIADPKFGGLFPDGISTSVLYGRTLSLAKGGSMYADVAAGFAATFLTGITTLN